MEMIIYTIAALLLYGVSDYILNAIEIKMGKRLPNRSLIFFAIISVLALSAFSVIEMVYKNPKPVSVSEKPQLNTATEKKEALPVQPQDISNPATSETGQPE